MRRFPKAIILSALAALVFLPRLGETCGPFFSAAIFARAHGPDRPMADFARGKIGVVLPDWYAVYRIVAYRYLESKPLSAEEQQSLLEHYDAERRIEPPKRMGQAAEEWVSARSQYNQEPAPIGLTDYKPTQNEFSSYPNCLAPALITAAATLKARAQRFGATSPELREWIRGQDAVFSNCSGGANIPPELPPTANPLLRADRAYQIAAAHFYAGPTEAYEITKGYEIALEDFQAIAADKSSPWHTLAPYLVARTSIRQAGVTAEENQTYNPAILAKAEVQLEAILKDPTQRPVHDDAESLLGFVRYRLHPKQRKSELSKLLAEGGIGIHFGQDLVDYTWLGVSPNPEHDDLSGWLSEGGSLEGAVAKWRATRSMPWLVAVLWQLKPRDAAFTEVMGAAAKVPPISEAYATVAYYRARLARQSGNVDLARGVLKAAWAQSKTFPPSAIHLFQDEQMQVATDFESFESRLWQNPIEYDDDVGNIDPCADSNEHDCGPQFSPAAATLLNTRVPAEVLARVAQWRTFPANLRKRMAPSAWARAALLDQSGLAREVAGAAGEAQPALKPYLQDYSQAQTPEERRFAAVFAILHFPGLRPYVDGPIPRLTPFQEIDGLRENWWCGDMGGDVVEINFEKCWREDGKGPLAFQAVPAAGTTPAHWEPVPTGPSLTSAGFPAFLSAAEKQRAATEWRELYALGTASRYLPRVVIDWGKKHPNDPRVPEALYLAIRAMRYGSSNELSHEAFLLLQQNYPKSEWARKTPFWFK
jgi:hypothetical protein